MTIDRKDHGGGRGPEERAGQAREGVDTETGEISQARLEAQRELEAFLGRVAGGGGQAAGGAGKRRRSKHRPAGGMSPLARRLLRLFVGFRAFRIFPLLALCFIWGGRKSGRRGKRRSGRGGPRGAKRRSGVPRVRRVGRRPGQR